MPASAPTSKPPIPQECGVSPPDAVQRDGLGLYVHFPWCLKKCPYCDFLSVAASQPEIPHEAYADALLRELDARLVQLQHPLPPLLSVFFGGGTPSLWHPRALGRVLAAVRSRLSNAESEVELEVTVECNPTSVDRDHFAALLDQGVNRVSIGVQSLDAKRLEFLGRLHDPAGALRALDAAQQAGVPRVSADLIFGVAHQSPEDASADVRRVVDAGVTHLSAYALTIEDGTRFGALHRKHQLPLLDEALVAASFEAVSQTLSNAGFEHYEVSNYAQPGQRSVHNIGYWTGRDYLALGAGAYGTVTLPAAATPTATPAGTTGAAPTNTAPERLRYRNLLSPERYLAAWAPDGASFDPFAHHLADREPIPPAVGVSEAILLGLRLIDGLAPEDVAARFGAPFFDEERRRMVNRLLERGRLEEVDGRLRIPRAHWLHADGIIRELL